MKQQDGDFQTLSYKEGSVGKKGGVPAGTCLGRPS